MGSHQLDEMRELAQNQRLADELGISLAIFQDLSPSIQMDEDPPYYLIVEFREDSPADLLTMVKGLKDGEFSLRLDATVLDEPDQWENEPWTEFGEVSEPYDVFHDSYCHLIDILIEYGEGGSGILKHSAPTITRMVFTQMVSALEAYLGDALIHAVMQDQNAILTLIEKDNELKASRFTLLDIAKNQNLVSNTVRQYLQGILYHNLAKVEKLYQIALNLDIWPNKEIKNILFFAIQQRHDCVYRNGRTKDGKEQILTTGHVQEILETVRFFVNHIEALLNKLKNN